MIDSPREIINRKELTIALSSTSDDIALFKSALLKGEKEIYTRFQQRMAGYESVRLRAFLIDQILRTLFDYTFKEDQSIALIAVGGYGRKELAPYSDIDILFLYEQQMLASNEKKIEKFLYSLWDLGFKIGYAARNIKATIQQASSDQMIYTSLLDARYIWGNKFYFEKFKSLFKNNRTKAEKDFFLQAKLEEREKRHEKYGDSRYVVEPNIKEGLGGLRDLQSLSWITKDLFGIHGFNELVEKGFITLKEKFKFLRAYNFLWSVRCHLHYVTKRPEERLTFALQTQLSERMNYSDRGGMKSVERFMKHFHFMVKENNHLTQTLITAIKAEFNKKNINKINHVIFKQLPKNYIIKDNFLMIENEKDFLTKPLNFLKIFYISQKFNLTFHPLLMQIIRRNVIKIGPELRNNIEANKIFLQIMLALKNVEPVLRSMSESGVLSRFIPDFHRIIAQMQFDMYHIYTVDEHTIFAIGILNRIEQNLLKKEFPLPSIIIKKISSRKILYISVFLHDIAKGKKGDHSILGADIAYNLCPRLGFTNDETKETAWLVLYHLLMSHTAFKRDLNDQKTIEDFVRKVQTSERLRHLYILTVVDIRAVGPNIWNDWKASLLKELFYKAEDLITGSTNYKTNTERKEYAKIKLKQKITKWPIHQVDEYVHNMSPEYWLAFNLEEQVNHAEIILKANDTKCDFISAYWLDKKKSATKIIIYAKDRTAMFANITGTLSAIGANIVEARIFMMKDKHALNVFWIHNFNGKPYLNKQRLENLGNYIKKIYANKINLNVEIAKRQKKFLKKSQIFDVSPQIYLDNNLSHTHSVIEIICSDKLGVLFKIIHFLSKYKIQISNAKISTYGEKIVDVFYVKSIYGLKLKNEKFISELKKYIEENA